MQVADLVQEMDALVLQGRMVDAVNQFYADDTQTLDFDGTPTGTKGEMVDKMNGFVGAIQNVNGITLHQTASNDTVSMSEYTFDFDMKDGSKVLWHEIIRREWKDGKVVNEQYFKN